MVESKKSGIFSKLANIVGEGKNILANPVKQYFTRLQDVVTSNGCSLMIGEQSEDFALASLSIPIGNNQNETYQIYKSISDKAQETKGKYGIACSPYCILKLDTEDEVNKKVLYLMQSRPEIPNIDNVDSVILMLETVRMVGGNYNLKKDSVDSKPQSFICKFPNGQQAELQEVHWTIGGNPKVGIAINGRLKSSFEWNNNYILSLSGHKELIIHKPTPSVPTNLSKPAEKQMETQVYKEPVTLDKDEERQAEARRLMEIAAKREAEEEARAALNEKIANEQETDAIRGRREYTSEIERMCKKCGVTGQFIKVVAIPKYRWNGLRFEKVLTTTGTIVRGYLDADQYILQHPSGKRYLLYVDNHSGRYFLITGAENPDDIIYCTHKQDRIIEAIN